MPPRGADDAACDLAAVGDQEHAEHRSTCRQPGLRFSRKAARPSRAFTPGADRGDTFCRLLDQLGVDRPCNRDDQGLGGGDARAAFGSTRQDGSTAWSRPPIRPPRERGKAGAPRPRRCARPVRKYRRAARAPSPDEIGADDRRDQAQPDFAAAEVAPSARPRCRSRRSARPAAKGRSLDARMVGLGQESAVRISSARAPASARFSACRARHPLHPGEVGARRKARPSACSRTALTSSIGRPPLEKRRSALRSPRRQRRYHRSGRSRVRMATSAALGRLVARTCPEAHIRNTPKRRPRDRALRAADSARASTMRVSAGSIMPSSHSLAVE